LADDLSSTARQLHDTRIEAEVALSSARLGLLRWDIASNRGSLSQLGAALLGQPNKQFDLASLRSKVVAEDLPLLDSALQVAQAGGVVDCELRLASAGATPRWLAFRGRVRRRSADDEGMLYGAVADVTERHVREAERQQLQAEAALHRDEITHLSRVAQLAELSGSLAHEINQPLAAILSNAQAGLRFLQASTPDLGEVRAALESVVDSDKRAGEVIRRLQTMMRKGDVDKQKLEINEVISEAVRIVDHDLLQRHVSISVELQPDLPPVCGDRVQIQQVLINLLVNGCDAMQSVGTSDCRLTVSTELAADDHVVVRVTDNGPGIPAEHLERIFAPFFTTKDAGLGLGLAVCNTIIQTHRGRLWAANSPRGATIAFSLPIMTSQASDAPAARSGGDEPLLSVVEADSADFIRSSESARRS
jgi:C4-dicarboxylate-specific signal transduction histidine kinase